MGSTFSLFKYEGPKYEVVKHFDNFEVRKYDPMNIVYTNVGSDHYGFKSLAEYIGVYGQPKNESNMKIPMSVPVITGPFIEGETKKGMAFYVPDKFSPMPAPTSENVHTATSEPVIMAIYKFSGSYGPDNVQPKVEEFEKIMEQNSIEKLNENWVLARYNPPWTLWFMRTNEIWWPVKI